jgi:hypothetical protein
LETRVKPKGKKQKKIFPHIKYLNKNEKNARASRLSVLPENKYIKLYNKNFLNFSSKNFWRTVSNPFLLRTSTEPMSQSPCYYDYVLLRITDGVTSHTYMYVYELNICYLLLLIYKQIKRKSCSHFCILFN